MTLQNARIPELPQGATINSNDLFVFYDVVAGITKYIIASDFLPSTGDTSGAEWVSNATYNTNDVVVSNNLWWISLQDNNIGNIPTENAFWTQINKVTSSGLKKWETGLYTENDVYVVHDLILYELDINAGRPYNSIDNPAIDANWFPVGGGGGSNTEILDTYNDLITYPNPENAQMFYVLDASGDPTVNAGGAQYIYRLADTSFIKIAEFESQDIDFTNFTRNDTGENNLDITPADTNFYSTILTGGKAKLKAIIDYLTTNRDLEKVVDLGNLGGAVNVDLSQGSIFKINVTADITFDFSNAVIGREYTFIFTGTANYNITWTAAKFKFPYGNILNFTPATGNTPAGFEDMFIFKCVESGVLHVSFMPDFQIN